MNCPHCQATNDADATFCVSCGQSIPQLAGAATATGSQQTYQATYQNVDPFTVKKTADGLQAGSPKPISGVGSFAPGEGLVMRAGQRIWHFTEKEGEIKPNQRRPLLIVDEEVVYLAKTTRRLEPQDLLERVQHRLSIQQVPVDVQMINANWVKDMREVRPRLVASLRNHSCNDVKIVMGVDYMGNWASIQLHVGYEPEPIPAEPPLPSWKKPTDAIIALIVGGLLLVLGLTNRSPEYILFGLLALIYGGVRPYYSYKVHLGKLAFEKAKRLAELAQREIKKAEESLSRTFKIDDMRLFSTAMRQVFRDVVDDIVESGAEIVRIEGGRGGFFQTEQAATRFSDAAEAEV